MEEVVVHGTWSATSGHKMVGYATVAEGEEDANLRRGPWSIDEDLVLVNYIAQHGEGRWNSLARAAGLKRTGKSCRLRWLNYLRPDVRRGNITPEEQLLILELHSRWGNRWSKIAEQLPGRTDNEIKNYWRTRVQKHARHLRCDVNSERFRDLMRRIWIPRLLDRIKIESAANDPNSLPLQHQPPLPNPNLNIINNHNSIIINRCYYSHGYAATILTSASPSSSNNSTASASDITTVHQLEGSELLPTTTARSFDATNITNGGGGGDGYLEMDQSLWPGGGVGLQQLPDSIWCADGDFFHSLHQQQSGLF